MSTLSSATPSMKPDWNPWPVGLVVFLGLFVSAVVGFGIFAIRHNQDLISADYYDREIRYQEQIDRVARTRALPQAVTTILSADARSLDLHLPSGAKGRIQLYRPSDARLDREFDLSLDPKGRQVLDISSLEPGLWKVRVKWTAGGKEFFHDGKMVIPKR